LVQDTEVDYSNVITIGGHDIHIGDSTAAKKSLPPGTQRNVFQGYEEVSVPAVDPGKLLANEKLVQISELDGWAQSAFKGYKQLNRIQSRIFEVRLLDCTSCCVCKGYKQPCTTSRCACSRRAPAPLRPYLLCLRLGGCRCHAVSLACFALTKHVIACGTVHVERGMWLQVGYRSNQNMLVCAPTGAGKTNIAMVAVLHEVGQHRDAARGAIRKDEFKVVYVAPMKALAAEVTRTFGSRLEALGLQARPRARLSSAPRLHSTAYLFLVLLQPVCRCWCATVHASLPLGAVQSRLPPEQVA
jgi:DEAD/DEAH box helicase